MNIFEEIKEKVSLATEFEKKGLILRPAGNNKLKCCCPFHNEKTPSMFVNLVDPEYYYCQGCKATGDVIEFVKNYDKLSMEDTLKYFAEKYGIQYSDDIDFNNIVIEKKKKSYKKHHLNYLDDVSSIVNSFLKKSDNPQKDFKLVKACLKSIYESISDENIEYYNYLRRIYVKQLIKKEIPKLKKGDKKDEQRTGDGL